MPHPGPSRIAFALADARCSLRNARDDGMLGVEPRTRPTQLRIAGAISPSQATGHAREDDVRREATARSFHGRVARPRSRLPLRRAWTTPLRSTTFATNACQDIHESLLFNTESTGTGPGDAYTGEGAAVARQQLPKRLAPVVSRIGESTRRRLNGYDARAVRKRVARRSREPPGNQGDDRCVKRERSTFAPQRWAGLHSRCERVVIVLIELMQEARRQTKSASRELVRRAARLRKPPLLQVQGSSHDALGAFIRSTATARRTAGARNSQRRRRLRMRKDAEETDRTEGKESRRKQVRRTWWDECSSNATDLR
ncbi:hypothetical protein ONZ51_g11630 [Trametes cubensis]|uniref:Uncharacterized protein n=1 Tax=Trametes cubensis TaxID=1111947 RepID=A0AAD7TIX5_9APHY|nr:hypothetical protein ONZ51_g11630 [Trametes cubensis]